MNKKKKIKILKITIFSVIAVLIVWITVIVVDKLTDFNPELQSNLDTLEKVLEYHDITLLSKKEPLEIEESEFDIYLYVQFPYPTFENNEVNDIYYINVINMLAEVLKYKRIEILDDDKNLKIDIVCNQTTKSIKTLNINGDNNYFENIKTKLLLTKRVEEKITDVAVHNKIINELMLAKWNAKAINYGTVESKIDSYDIYFDEGIEVRNIENKVFNIVFTEKHTTTIINDITTKNTIDEVINKLGEPTFGRKTDGIIGYQTKGFYIFFSNNQISIYPVDTTNTDEFAKLVSQFIENKDSKAFINNVKNMWKDYDTDYFSGAYDVELSYALKGIKIQFNQGKQNGISLYNNFKGNIYQDASLKDIIEGKKELPKNVYLNNDNLIYENEKKRCFGIHNNAVAHAQYVYQYNDTINKFPELVNDTTSNDYKNKSDQFFIVRDGKIAYVQSINNTSPPFQINTCLSTLWADSTHLIYSTDGDGIFIYNAVTRENNKILDESEGVTLNLQEYKDGTLIYDNGKEIKCSIK